MTDATTLTQLHLDRLHPAEDNPRRDVDEVDELAKSIAAQGVLQPLVVSPNGDHPGDREPGGAYVIVAGHRRAAAARKAGLESVPCIVRELTDEQRLEVMLVENLQRTDLDPLEEAVAFERLVGTYGYSQRDLADKVGCSQPHVSKRLQLLKLPDAARQALDDGTLTIGEALELAKLADHPQRLLKALKDTTSRSISVAVAKHLREIEREEHVDQLRADLEKKGVPEVAYDDLTWNVTDASNPVRLRTLDGGYIVEGDHEDHDCHAVAINPHLGEVEAVCTDPKGHQPAQLELTPEDRQQRQQDQEVKAADDARWLACTQAAQHAPRAAALMHVLRSTIGGWTSVHSMHSAYQRARDLLGLSGGADHDSAKELIVAYANEGSDQAVRALLALVLSDHDVLATRGHVPHRHLELIETHFAFLANHSDWEPSQIEKDALSDALDKREALT